MKSLKEQPILLFVLCAVVIVLPLCLFPINLFSGQIVYESDIQQVVVDAPLSLSYFFGLGYEETDMEHVTDFYLTTPGYLTAFIFLIGIPGLIAYRVYLSSSKK